MSEQRLEVLLTSESSGQMFNMAIWDPVTGTNLKIYKGNTTKAKTCCMLGNTFLVSGQTKQQLLNVWQLNKHEQKPLKYITPGVLQSLAASPCGHLLVGTAEERIYVWQTSSGKLLRIINTGHYHSSFRGDVLCSLPTGKCVVEPLLSYHFVFNIPQVFHKNASSATI